MSSGPTPGRAQPGSGIAPSEYAFDDFRVDVGQRELCRGNATVRLPSRAFDALVYLIEHRGRCVHKEELIAASWNDVVVTDDSLIHAISVLRRALGDERQRPKYIQTIPRRGYRFIGDVRLSGRPTEAAPGPRRKSPSRSPVGRPVRMAGLAIAAAMLAAIAVFQFGRPSAENAQAASIRLFQPAPPDTSIVSGGVLSPDGRHLAFVARNETQGRTALWVRALHSSELRRIEGTDGASKPFWSPDSRRIGYFANGDLLAIDLEGGTPQTIAPVFAAAGGTWGLDDTILFAEWATGLFTVPASGDGEVRTVAVLDREAEDIVFAWPQFFPDGRRFLYQIVSLEPARTGVYVGDLRTLESFKLLDTTSSATLAPPHHVLHVKNDMLIAEELDLQHSELTGRAIVVARDISEPSLAAENVVSASADLLAFQHGVTRQNLVWVDRAGRGLESIAIPTVLYNPRISPDGSHLLGSSSVTIDPGLWLVSLDREEYTRLETDAVGPVWSPDGLSVAFTSRGGFDLLIRAIERPEKRRMLMSDNNVKILNDWSPDGRQLIYTTRAEPTGLDLWIVDVETGAARPLLATPHSDTQARISPDGAWIAYASDESGVLETYVARFPGLDDKRMISAGGGGQPQWRSDQSELYYLSPDQAVMAVDVNEGGATTFGSPRKLFRASVAGGPGDARDYFAAAAGGTRFLIDSAVNENDGQAITIMVNWAAGMPERQLDAARSSQASWPP